MTSTAAGSEGRAPLAHPWTFQGTVISFDIDAGLGVVSAVDNGGSWQFHCTSIADGSREIAVGAEVSFRVTAGRPGTWEAQDLTITPVARSE